MKKLIALSLIASSVLGFTSSAFSGEFKPANRRVDRYVFTPKENNEIYADYERSETHSWFKFSRAKVLSEAARICLKSAQLTEEGSSIEDLERELKPKFPDGGVYYSSNQAVFSAASKFGCPELYGNEKEEE